MYNINTRYKVNKSRLEYYRIKYDWDPYPPCEYVTIKYEFSNHIAIGYHVVETWYWYPEDTLINNIKELRKVKLNEIF